MARERMVMAMVDRITQYGRGVLAGISRYAMTQPNLSVYPLTAMDPHQSAAQVYAMKPDGVIVRGRDDEAWTHELRRSGVPVVLVAHVLEQFDFPAVLPDYVAIGRMGAEHLIEQGYHRLAFRGTPHTTMRLVMTGFHEAARQAGCEFDAVSLRNEPTISDAGIIDVQRQWLRGQSKPVGVMTSADDSAIKIMLSARLEKLVFGREIAVIGVGNDSLLCECCRPTMSSVALPIEQIGYKAAELLDHLMQGGEPPEQPIRMQPTRVVVRGSTDLAATDDVELAQAVSFIRDRFRQHLSVPMIAEHVGLSRRTLERRFHKHLSRTVDGEVRRQRVEQAKRLLVESDMALKRIAQMCGFARPEQLSRTFKQLTGLSPITFRKDHGPR